MIKIEKKGCYITVDEPGDGTHYEFVIIFKRDSVIITGLDGAIFCTYEYKLSSIKELVEKYPILSEQDISYDEYRQSVSEILFYPYITYIVEHSRCNPWTAIAAVRAVVDVLKGTYLWRKKVVKTAEERNFPSQTTYSELVNFLMFCHEQMKCCGNCIHGGSGYTECVEITKLRRESYTKPGWGYCSKWEYDGLTCRQRNREV